MTAQDIARYAEQVQVQYPTSDGAELYKIAEIVPRHLRTVFEVVLGDAFTPYFEEVLRRKQDPPERPISDILAVVLAKRLCLSREALRRLQARLRDGSRNALPDGVARPEHESD